MAKKKKEEASGSGDIAAGVAPPIRVQIDPAEAFARDADGRGKIRGELRKTLLVEAGAGSGKTTEMVNRMLALIASGECEIERLAAVTYTRKAAAELRDRFELELAKAWRTISPGIERDRIATASKHFSRACIGTVHSFCARILREFPIEAGLDLNFQELDEREAQAWASQAWSEYIDSLHTDDNKAMLDEVRSLRFDVRDAEKGFFSFVANSDISNWPTDDLDFQSVVKRLEERRVLDQVSEFVDRIRGLVAEFPPASERGSDKFMSGYESIEHLCDNLRLDNPSELLECLQAFPKMDKDPVQKYWPRGRDDAKNEGEIYRTLYSQVIAPAILDLFAARYRIVIELYRKTLDHFRDMKKRARVLNFQDLLTTTAEMLRRSREVREFLRDRYTHLLVDEFQDTDPLQAEIMFLLTADDPDETDWQQCRPRPGSLFVVGDPKQSIYRFKRGDIQTYQLVKEKIAKVGEVVALTKNHRTRKEIVTWFNEVFSTKFPETATPASPVFEPMAAAREDANSEATEQVVIRKWVASEQNKDSLVPQDAATVARQIDKMLQDKRPLPRKESELRAGIPEHATPGDFMIIHLKKDELHRYASELRNREIPVQVTGGAAFSAGLIELETLRDLLIALTEPENPIALVAVLRGAMFGINDEDLYAFQQAGGRFHFLAPQSEDSSKVSRIHDAFQQLAGFSKLLKTLPPVTAVEQIVEESGLLASALVSEDSTAASTLLLAIEKLRLLQADVCSPAQLAQLLQEMVEQRLEVDSLPIRDHGVAPVRIMNLHKAKGLEAPIVFLANPTGEYSHTISLAIDRRAGETQGYLAIFREGKNRGTLIAAHSSWSTQEESEGEFLKWEKSRLRYVAATRAGVQLNISHKGFRPGDSPWTELADAIANPPENLGQSDNNLDANADRGTEERRSAVDSVEVPATSIDDALRHIADRRDQLLAPSYAMVSAKEFEKGKGAARQRSEVEVDFKGPAWGTVIHQLLEMAIIDPTADLRILAVSAAQEAGLLIEAADEAVEVVNAVLQSDFWNRVKNAQQRLVEVPFAITLLPAEDSNPLPTTVKGVIDLAFREEDQWVIVDYKTDVINPDGLKQLAETYRGQIETYRKFWMQIVKQPVKEAGVFSVRLKQFQVVD
jgi:ATP-dependent helicase/nuclease subunit A